jgi:hypothetical protein
MNGEGHVLDHRLRDRVGGRQNLLLWWPFCFGLAGNRAAPMGQGLANVLAIFAPAVAFVLAFLTSFVLVFLTLRVLLNVAGDFAARPPRRRPPQRRWWAFYLLSPDKDLPWRPPVAISASRGRALLERARVQPRNCRL